MAEQPKRPQNPWVKSLGLWVVILLVLAVVVTVVQGPSTATAAGALGYSDFLTKVDEGSVKSVDIRGNAPTDPQWAAGLAPGWQRARRENFADLVMGRPNK